MACLSLTSWQQSERAPALIAHPLAASLDEAHAAIELWEYYSRKRLDADQRLAVELMMAEAEDGRWAADTTGRAESRQNGKGDEIEVVELWGLLQRSEAILHTAHEAATAASAHGRMIGLVEGHRDLRVKIKKKQSWNGNYSLQLINDGLIVWRTRTGAGGRGLDDISRIVVDEAQHAQPEELASSLPILSVNPNPQKNFMGSGGVAGKSAFWWRQRRRALAATSGRFSWLEHSAETVTVDADGRLVTSMGDVADPETWRRANPAYPARISHDFLLDQLETLGPALFAREHLCVWDPEPGATDGDALDPDLWNRLADASVAQGQRVAYSLEVGLGRTSATVGAAWDGPAGPHLTVAKHGDGTDWIVPTLKAARESRGSLDVTLDAGTEALSFREALEAEGISVHVAKSAERAAMCGRFHDAVLQRGLSHDGQPLVATAIAGSTWRVGAEGARSFARKGGADISPLYALVLALEGLTASPPSVYETRGVLIV